VIRLLETIDARESAPTLTVYRGEPRKILRCTWNDFVLDQSVVSLLKTDFESFWNREQWFRDRGIPFRRGYLLHGSPGNGKTSLIRAMMSSRNLNAFTLRFFDPQTDDSALEGMIDEALSERPAMIVLEDLDRAFPRTGESRTQVSMQALLNHLDGVATGEGLVIVGTANDPAALAPAILRRPGRFDRVVRFPSPNENLRREYFKKMKLNLEFATLDRPVADSAGFSFAQLRESVILAAQFAFERDDNIRSEDLLRGVHVLRETMAHSSAPMNQAGFAPSAKGNGAAA
jgi:ATP-dependent 26S proteasome regulatory subunit